jgi:hypothetical protein
MSLTNKEGLSLGQIISHLSLCSHKHITTTRGLFCVSVVLGFELRGYTLSHSTSPILCVCVCEGFFEIGSLELYARAGFKL